LPSPDSDDFVRVAFPEVVWQTKASAWFARHTVFRVEEFIGSYAEVGRSRRAAVLALQYYVRKGQLLNLRRGLYAVEGTPPDPLLIASRLTKDAVLAYGSALWFHKLSPGEDLCAAVSRSTAATFDYRNVTYRVVPAPLSLNGHEKSGVHHVHHLELPVSVTTLERTFVDCLDRLNLGPGVGAIFQAFNDCEQELDPDAIADHAERLQNRVCAARVGLMLQSHRVHRSARDALRRLYRMRPGSPTYAVPGAQDCFFVARWNVMIPRPLYNRLHAVCAPGWNANV
jgi:predicted transcriptional regulator of viral defense system